MSRSTQKHIAALLSAAKEGDKESLHRLCRELERFIRGYFETRFHDPDLVDDLCQDTYVRLIANILTVREPMKLRSFVAKVAMHVSNDYLRKKYRNLREQSFDVDETKVASADGDPIGEYETEATLLSRMDVNRALAQLPERSRAILLLKMAGFKYEEISKEFDLSVSGVKMQVKRSLETLKTLLYSVTFFLLTTTHMFESARSAFINQPGHHEQLQ